ncbi:MAG: hypothetical protein ACK5WH_00010 [Hyphomonadaceae bacterium]
MFEARKLGWIVSAAIVWSVILSVAPSMQSKADAQSRTRLAWPSNGNSGENERRRAQLPQQAVTFVLQPTTHEAALAGLPSSAAALLPASYREIGAMSQTVRVHDLYNVTMLRSKAFGSENGVSYYNYTLYMSYDNSWIPRNPPALTASVTVDVLFNARDFEPRAADEFGINWAHLNTSRTDELTGWAGLYEPDGRLGTYTFYITTPYKAGWGATPFWQY